MFALRMYAFTEPTKDPSRCLIPKAKWQQLTKLDIHLDGLIDIFQCLWKSHQLHISSRAVIVSSWIRRVALNALCVVLDSSSEVARLKLGIPVFPSNRTLLRVDVGLTVFLCLETLNLTQLVEDIRCAMLRKRLLVILNGGGEITLLLVGDTCSSQGFCDEFEICTKLKKIVRIRKTNENGWQGKFT